MEELRRIPDTGSVFQNRPNIYDKEFILRFLRNTKYDLPKAKERILRYYTYRRDYPEWLQNRDPLDECIQNVLNFGIFVSMGNHRQNNCFITIARANAVVPDLVDVDAVSKLLLLYVDVFNLDKMSQIAGMVCIFDFQGFGVKHLTQVTPPRMQKMICCGLQGMPCKVKGIHIINAPVLVQGIISICKLFLPEKLRKRVYSYGSDYLDLLHSNISVDCLPSEYGGTAGPLEHYSNMTKNIVMDLREYILMDDTYGFVVANSPNAG